MFLQTDTQGLANSSKSKDSWTKLYWICLEPDLPGYIKRFCQVWMLWHGEMSVSVLPRTLLNRCVSFITLFHVCTRMSPQPSIGLLSGNFIRDTLLVQCWTPFNCISSSCHRFKRVLERFLTQLLHLVGCIWISHSTTYQRCSTRLSLTLVVEHN